MLKKIFKQELHPAKVVDVTEVGDEFSELGWSSFFDESFDLPGEEEGDSFRVFRAGELSTARFVWVLLHGAGQSALVWSHVASELKMGGHAVVAFDARGHGASRHKDEKTLSRERLAKDCAFVALHSVGETGKKACLVGHSMGGAVVVEAAALPQLAGRVAGVAVLDVVEGTAMASLATIRKFVNSRPVSFSSPSQAVRWVVDSGLLKSSESARVSVPGQLRKSEDGGEWVWRMDLGASSDYWQGWYEDMSKRFLAIPLPKLLLLAGMDRLDTALTIAQMQGRFQLGVFPMCTHQLHEEAPREVADKLVKFSNRF